MKYDIGSKEQPVELKTPPLTSTFTMHTGEKKWNCSTGLYGRQNGAAL
jgi:hypothetical protein